MGNFYLEQAAIIFVLMDTLALINNVYHVVVIARLAKLHKQDAKHVSRYFIFTTHLRQLVYQIVLQ
jgi:hypothetical protein